MGIGGLVTDTWVVSEGGCASAASGDLRSGAPHTIISYPILQVLLLIGSRTDLPNKAKRHMIKSKYTVRMVKAWKMIITYLLQIFFNINNATRAL